MENSQTRMEVQLAKLTGHEAQAAMVDNGDEPLNILLAIRKMNKTMTDRFNMLETTLATTPQATSLSLGNRMTEIEDPKASLGHQLTNLEQASIKMHAENEELGWERTAVHYDHSDPSLPDKRKNIAAGRSTAPSKLYRQVNPHLSDFPEKVMRQRQAFEKVQKRLKEAGARVGFAYPAWLRVTLSDSQKIFSTPTEGYGFC